MRQCSTSSASMVPCNATDLTIPARLGSQYSGVKRARQYHSEALQYRQSTKQACTLRFGHSGACRSAKQLQCSARLQDQPQAQASTDCYDPVSNHATAFAPATIANLGPGFDWLGCAVDGEGDTVTATVREGTPGEVTIEAIEGDGGRLSLTAADNCVGIAAIETLKLIGRVSCGVSLRLKKGLPLGSGMGSSAASAAAGAWAVNCLFGMPLSKEQLVIPGLTSEATVSGYHADNIAPALLGGFILIRSCEPLDIQQLPFPGDLHFVLVNPKFEAPTKEMRAALPKQIPMSANITNCSQGASLVAGILLGDSKQLGQALNSDTIVEPVRGPLIPGFKDVKAAALSAGAYGCTISGAGPTCVAVVASPKDGERVADAMVQAFVNKGNLEVNSARVACLDQEGARLVPDL